MLAKARAKASPDKILVMAIDRSDQSSFVQQVILRSVYNGYGQGLENAVEARRHSCYGWSPALLRSQQQRQVRYAV